MKTYSHILIKKLLTVFFLVSANSSHANDVTLKCANAIDESMVLIQFILHDIKKNYTWVGGGGITEIKETATYQFDVRLPQEERVDVIRYQLSINKNCKVKIIKKEESVISYPRQ